MPETSFLELSPEDIKDFVVDRGEPAYRAKQVQDWLFAKQVQRPEDMLNVAKTLRESLRQHFDWRLPAIDSAIEAADGSTKLLLRTHSGQLMEAVILRYPGRTTLCVSSQVGCKLACRFCQTGKLGFMRHLTTAEILSQYVLANSILESERKRVTNVVFMGMGEPLDNYDHCVAAANRLIHDYGLSHRRVTLSTSGLVPRIEQLITDSPAALAISLHACRDDLRTELMPINRKYPLARLKQALLRYQAETKKKITIEYILIKDKNCGPREAKELVRFLHGLRAKVNLIPFNAHPGMPFDAPDDVTVRSFQKYLADRSFPAPVRYSKGQDISAACGQLAAKKLQNLAHEPKRASLLH